jgi:hypothetical protein
VIELKKCYPLRLDSQETLTFALICKSKVHRTNRAEQSRAEQNRTEQSRAGQSRAEKNREKQRKI